MSFIQANQNYLLNPQGATRVLYGAYAPELTSVGSGSYHNGGYWYITTLHLARAYRRLQMPDALADIVKRIEKTINAQPRLGLIQWYAADGSPLGQSNYSWSLGTALDIVLREIVGVREGQAKLSIQPCIANGFGTIESRLVYRKHFESFSEKQGCLPEHNLLDDAMDAGHD